MTKPEPGPQPSRGKEPVTKVHVGPYTDAALQTFRVGRDIAIDADVRVYLTLSSLGLDPSLTPVHRYIPVGLYVAGKSVQDEQRVAAALMELLKAAGFVSTDRITARHGSLLFRSIFRSRDTLTLLNLEERMSEVESHIRTAFEARTEAEIERKIAETRKIKAETRKANAEALNALSEASLNVAKVVLRVSIAFSLVVGTVGVTKANSSSNEPVKVVKLAAETAYKLWQNELPNLTSVTKEGVRHIAPKVKEEEAKKESPDLPDTRQIP